MNENAQKWVEALESGEYQQGRGWLCADGAFCCLGVACDLAVKAGVEIAVERRKPVTASVTAYDGDLMSLPRPVMDWLGLTSDDGSFYEGHIQDNLVDLNDMGKSFKEIAALIRSEPPGLFKEDA